MTILEKLKKDAADKITPEKVFDAFWLDRYEYWGPHYLRCYKSQCPVARYCNISVPLKPRYIKTVPPGCRDNFITYLHEEYQEFSEIEKQEFHNEEQGYTRNRLQ